MTPALTPLRGTRISWTTLLGLLLVPLTVAGLFLWGLWSPSDRLETITAAVVNEDVPVEVDGQLVPLGRVLAAELIAGGGSAGGGSAGVGSAGVGSAGAGSAAGDEPRQNFTWVLTDAQDAKDGLNDGRFATAITIPKHFSDAATSLSKGPEEARSATIQIAESDRGRLLDTALSSIVTQTATRVLNQQLGEQFVGSVFVGMSSLHDGVSSAATGAGKLADGGRQLADGAGELATGTEQLADGTQQLAGGAQQLAGGADGLTSGAWELAAGVRSAAQGGSGLADGVEQYTGTVNSVLDAVISGAGQALAPLQQLKGTIEGLPEELFPPEFPKADAIAAINAAIDEVGNAASGSEASDIVKLRNAGSELAAGARASANGQNELAAGAENFASGVGVFAQGANTLSAGVNELAAQTPELAAGAGTLAAGADAAAAGTKTLADGLNTAVAQIPNYTESERDVMSKAAIESVVAEGESGELFNAAGVPLFAGIALWAGALAAFLVLSPLWSRTRDAAKGVFSLTLRSARPALLLGAAQGAIAGLVLPIALRYDLPQAAGFFGLAVLAGVAFALVVQGLSARFGGFGRFVAFGLLVVAFTVGIVSTVPGLLSAVGDASPIGAAFAGFQAIASGATGAGGASALLTLWGLGGVALTAWAIARERRA